MLETACSRITHIYRFRKKEVNTHLRYDFIHRVSSTYILKFQLFFFSLTLSMIFYIELQKSCRGMDGRVRTTHI